MAVLISQGLPAALTEDQRLGEIPTSAASEEREIRHAISLFDPTVAEHAAYEEARLRAVLPEVRTLPKEGLMLLSTRN